MDGVAPRAGAWIETLDWNVTTPNTLSHPVRVRGLKHSGTLPLNYGLGRTPCGCVD